ncbi:hypothetical protein FXE87_05360 [Vibrio mimicus]|nr:hypothetical protein [Vibrio vulnificus]EJL6932152.1 hypothetical protein [Vibrio cholerae]EKO3905503.1 hypothetical protein [Vibrio fluvialis]TXY29056.1 hypothetical protein FXE87_05360 [Vibrio mimicus]HCG5102772.1 hypothetical protein [Vibrio parahaemolyticus]
MKKSEVIVDLTKIHERIDVLLNKECLKESKGELADISSKIKKISENLNSGCLTYSITGRATAQSQNDKCRFCGK